MSAVWGWSKVECTPDGGAPCQRSLHAAAVLKDSIYIFGGMVLALYALRELLLVLVVYCLSVW